MPDIELVNISKYICRNVNLRVVNKEIFVVVGTTGAGKTTLLNVVAGVTDYEGSVLIDGVNVDMVSPRKRGVGYLFQGLSLFPHLTVQSNIAFGLQAAGVEKAAADERVSSLMEMMRITHLAARYPHMLSGGEKKRVALARSLAPSPQILLLDEPTSSLDHQTAKYLRNELLDVLKKLGITTVYVTHDLREAEEIADRIAFMSKGKVEQALSPRDFFFNQRNERISEFIGMPNIIECTQSRVLTAGLVELIFDEMRMVLPYEGNNINIRKIAIMPQDIYISDKKPPGPALNRYKGTVTEIVPLRSVVRIRVNIDGNSLLTELSTETFDEMDLAIGHEVFVVIKLRRLRYVEEFEDHHK